MPIAADLLVGGAKSDAAVIACTVCCLSRTTGRENWFGDILGGFLVTGGLNPARGFCFTIPNGGTDAEWFSNAETLQLSGIRGVPAGISQRAPGSDDRGLQHHSLQFRSSHRARLSPTATSTSNMNILTDFRELTCQVPLRDIT